MSKSIPQLLKEHLDIEDFRLVEAASSDWTHALFEFDPELQAFLVVAEDAAEDELDALLRAAEVLTRHRSELGSRAYPLAPDAAEATGEISYTFEPDRLAAADKLEELLAATDFRVETRQLAGGRRAVTVEFPYRSDFDYARQKGHVDWLADMAARLGQGTGFRGQRLP